MKTNTRPITPQRLDRLLRWSTLMMMRLAAWIVHVAGLAAPLERALDKALRPKLDYFARGVCWLIAAKAVLRTELPKRRRGGKPLGKSHQTIRSLVGSRLRKLVRARDLRAKIAAILSLINNAEREIEHFVRRLRIGLTRRCGGLALASLEAGSIVWAYLYFSAVIADTS